MSRHYLLLLNGPVAPALIDRLRRLDPAEPFLHLVVPPIGSHESTRSALQEATASLRDAGYEVHADFGTVATMRQQGWPFEGLVLAVAPDDPSAWIDVSVGQFVDGEFPLLAAA